MRTLKPTVFFAVVGGLTIWSGCVPLPPEAIESIRQAHTEYETGQYAQAACRLAPVITEHPNAAEIAEAYYVRALCRLQSGDPSEAKADLLAGLQRSRRAELTARIKACLGNLAYEQGRHDIASSYYAGAVEELPDRHPKDLILYRYGVCLQRDGQWTKARRTLRKIPVAFPKSPIASEARRKAQWPNDYYILQCGVFADQSNARRLVDKLRGRSLTAEYVPDCAAGATRYVVRVGRYKTYDCAQKGLEAVKRVQDDAIIIP